MASEDNMASIVEQDQVDDDTEVDKAIQGEHDVQVKVESESPVVVQENGNSVSTPTPTPTPAQATTQDNNTKKQHPSGKTLIVNNIPCSAFFTMTDQLKERFQKYGVITYIKRGGITVDFDTVFPTLSAYVNFETTEAAEKALAERGTEYEGNALEVEVLKGGPFTVVASNLPYNISKSCLMQLMEPCGTIKEIIKIPARPTAFIDFEDEEGMKKALSLNGTLVINNVEIVFQKKDEQRPNAKQKKDNKPKPAGIMKMKYKRPAGGQGNGGGGWNGPRSGGNMNRPMVGGFNVWENGPPFRGGGAPRQGGGGGGGFGGGPANYGNNNWGVGNFRDGGNMDTGFKRRKQNDWLWQY